LFFLLEQVLDASLVEHLVDLFRGVDILKVHVVDAVSDDLVLGRVHRQLLHKARLPNASFTSDADNLYFRLPDFLQYFVKLLLSTDDGPRLHLQVARAERGTLILDIPVVQDLAFVEGVVIE